MSEAEPVFNHENILRIYRGEPALAYGRFPEEALTDQQYEAVNLLADGLNRRDISSELDTEHRETKAIVDKSYKVLGITSKDQLAAFLPWDTSYPSLEDKKLNDLTKHQLAVVQGLSIGLTRDEVAESLRTSRSSINTSIGDVKRSRWSECETPTNVIRVANAIRAGYVQEFERPREGREHSRSIESHLGIFALGNLVKYEPEMREMFGMDQ